MKKYFLQMRVILLILLTICVITCDTEAYTVQYAYDDAGRLIEENYGDKTITYKYDNAGNLLERKITDGVTDISPVPDIKANGSDEPVTVTLGTNLTVTVSLDPGSHTGENADWWVYVTSPFGTYWFTLDSWWQASDTHISVYGGPLFNLSTYTVLDISTLPAWDYDFNFSVDDNMDNIKDDTYLDSVSVTIQ